MVTEYHVDQLAATETGFMVRSKRLWATLLAGIIAVIWHVGGLVAIDGRDPGIAWAQGDPPLVPAPMEMIYGPPGDDILNILLLGSDTTNPANAGRTDVLIVVSVNRTRGAVHLLAIPRDLYIHVPEGDQQRINTVYGVGEHSAYEEGGYGLLKAVLRHNLGLQIDRYARVDFNGFQAIVDALGGIEVSVPCALQDWALKAPDLDPLDEQSWELVTLGVGVHNLTGYEALWYARSRRTSSDFDRGRRQQDIVRAIWRKANALGLVTQVPMLWSEITQIVQTDMTVADWLGLLPTALTVDPEDIAQFRFQQDVDVRAWRTPVGEAVQLPVRERVAALVERFMQPLSANRLGELPVRVEVINASGVVAMDRVVADMLSWEGYAVSVIPAGDTGYQRVTTIYDYYGGAKGGWLQNLVESLRLSEQSEVVVLPSAERHAEYRVLLGGDYRSCQFGVMAPVPTPVPQ